MRFSVRRLWSFVTPITILVCAIFAGKSAANIFGANVLEERSTAAPLRKAPARAEAKAPPRSKSSASLLARNMFCSQCSASEPLPDKSSPSTRTRLPLRLIATNIASQSEYSFASVLNTTNQRQGGYRVGQRIPNAGVVESIDREWIRFTNLETNQSETIHLDTGAIELSATSRAASASSKSGSLADEYVRTISSTHFEVDRKLVETLRGDPTQAGARARPLFKQGKMEGVRLFALRSSGLAHHMGLRNGDTLVAANGVTLTSLEAGLELMGQLESKDHWSLDIRRRGKPLTIQVDLQ